MTQQINWAAFIFGGLFIGAWLYGLLFGYPEWHDFSIGAWFFWGALGIAIAGGLYAATLANQGVKIGVIIAVGICLGLLILAAITRQEAHIIGTFVAGAGAGLIVAGLPRAPQWEQVDAPAPE